MIKNLVFLLLNINLALFSLGSILPTVNDNQNIFDFIPLVEIVLYIQLFMFFI